MSNTKKLIVNFILLIALCVSVTAGLTFALFAKEDSVNIAITMGKIDVQAYVGKPEYSGSQGEIKVVGNEISIENIQNGESVRLPITIENRSTISVKYQVELRSAEKSILTVFCSESEFVWIGNNTLKTKWTSMKSVPREGECDTNTLNLTIELPSNVELSHTSCRYTIAVYAVQENRHTEDPVAAELSFEYERDEDSGTVTIVGITDFAGYKEITVPATIEGMPVTAIGDKAFWECTITSVTLPDTVKTIGDLAFADTKLASIDIPASVETIGDWAFAETDLASVAFGKGSKLETIGAKAFYGCESLESMEIPAEVISIGAYAFSGCERLKSITLPENITAIGDYAFAYCAELTSITIPANVETIGRYAFRECAKLTNVVFSDGSALKAIGEWAFYGCASLDLEGILFSGNWESVAKGENWNYGTKI